MDRQERILLDAILDKPNDDLARLIYADYLEENGRDSRARFIRWGVENPDHAPRIMYAERDFLMKGGMIDLPLWLMYRSDLSGNRRTTTHRRGFLENIACSHEDFLANAGELFSVQPIASVHIIDKTPSLENGRFCWWAGGYSSPNDSTISDYFLDESIRGSTVYPLKIGVFETPHLARMDLSVRCVAYGRRESEKYRQQ